MLARCLIIGPEVGSTMGKGGGCKVAVKMAETLAENGFKVCLSAFKGYATQYLDSLHNTSLIKWKDKIHTSYMFNIENKNEDRKVKGLSGIFPLHIGALPFSMYVRYVIRKFAPHIVIFHDDVPVFIKEHPGRLIFLYVHFSYATRFKLGVGEMKETRETLIKRSLRKFLDPLFKQLVLADNCPADVMIANSSITADYLKQTWNRNNITILHPPVDTSFYKSSCMKENLIVSLGSIQPSKRFGEVIKAISMIKSECKLMIVGHYLDGAYYQRLQRLIKEKGMRNKVTISLDATRNQVKEILSRAKAIVHASRFEPFGIAVVEGMASGCVPVVREEETSGPWIDIINKGEFGLGFRTIDELADNIEKVVNNEKVYTYYSRKALERSKKFDVCAFKEGFIRILKKAQKTAR